MIKLSFIFYFVVLATVPSFTQPSSYAIEKIVNDVMMLKFANMHIVNSAKVRKITRGSYKNEYEVICTFEYSGDSWFGNDEGRIDIQLKYHDDLFGGYIILQL